MIMRSRKSSTLVAPTSMITEASISSLRKSTPNFSPFIAWDSRPRSDVVWLTLSIAKIFASAIRGASGCAATVALPTVPV